MELSGRQELILTAYIKELWYVGLITEQEYKSGKFSKESYRLLLQQLAKPTGRYREAKKIALQKAITQFCDELWRRFCKVSLSKGTIYVAVKKIPFVLKGLGFAGLGVGVIVTAAGTGLVIGGSIGLGIGAVIAPVGFGVASLSLAAILGVVGAVIGGVMGGEEAIELFKKADKKFTKADLKFQKVIAKIANNTLKKGKTLIKLASAKIQLLNESKLTKDNCGFTNDFINNLVAEMEEPDPVVPAQPNHVLLFVTSLTSKFAQFRDVIQPHEQELVDNFVSDLRTWWRASRTPTEEECYIRFKDIVDALHPVYTSLEERIALAASQDQIPVNSYSGGTNVSRSSSHGILPNYQNRYTPSSHQSSFNSPLREQNADYFQNRIPRNMHSSVSEPLFPNYNQPNQATWIDDSIHFPTNHQQHQASEYRARSGTSPNLFGAPPYFDQFQPNIVPPPAYYSYNSDTHYSFPFL